MKTLFKRSAWGGLAVGLLLSVSFVVSLRFAKKDEAIALPLSRVVVRAFTLPPLSEPRPPGPEGEDPIPIGQPWAIDFLANPGDLGDNPGQRQDHLRDWLMRVAIARGGLPHEHAAGLDTTFVGGTHEGVRERLAGFGPGPVRWIETRPGEALVLLPKDVGDPSRIELARIADELAWKYHRVPERLLVFEYGLEAMTLMANLIRRPPIEGKSLFSGEYGYRVGLVSSPDELRDFLRDVDDVVTIQGEEGLSKPSLHLGGRRLPARPPHGLLPAQVTAAWPAFEAATKQARQFRAVGRDELSAFRMLAATKAGSYKDDLKSLNDSVRQRWFFGGDVEEEIGQYEKEAAEEAAALQDSLEARQRSLTESLNRRRAETDDAIHRAWADVPDVVRSAWVKMILDR